MCITLKKANINDCEEIHSLQIKSFAALLEKYQDHEFSSGAETIERIREKLSYDFSKYYFIELCDAHIGFIRVVALNEDVHRISPMGILPEYQGFGYAQMTITEVEKLYPNAKTWELDTIKQEEKLCYLYEKMGYVKTGKYQNIKEGMDLVFYAKQISGK